MSCWPISEESKRIATTALAPSSLAFSIIRSIACLRLSSSSSVYCETSPWRSALKPAPMALANPMLRTTRPKATPRSRSTVMPGSANAVVTGKPAAEGSVMAVILRQRQHELTLSLASTYVDTMSEGVVLAEAASGRDPAEGLRAARALRLLAERLEALQVDNARAHGWSWQEIAFFLGVSKQAVHKKHAKRGA